MIVSNQIEKLSLCDDMKKHDYLEEGDYSIVASNHRVSFFSIFRTKNN